MKKKDDDEEDEYEEDFDDISELDPEDYELITPIDKVSNV